MHRRVFMLALGFFCGHAVAGQWPQLAQPSNNPHCQQALRIGTATFQSNAFKLFDAPVIPADLASALVLEAVAGDISGGDAIKADPAAFDKLKIDNENAPSIIHWQKKASNGKRLVVQDTPFNWQGDTYTTFMLNESVSQQQFLNQAKSAQPPAIPAPVIDGSWRPPLVLQDKQSGQAWVIDVGHPADILGAWQVYTTGADGTKLRCTVQFAPKLSVATSLLPPAVRQLITTLGQTLGSGKNEGTMQSTGRIRIVADQAWANAALRPWALAKPYNSKEEVDAGLLNWSRRGPLALKTYNNILAQTIAAENALAQYYQSNFKFSAEEAKTTAATVLETGRRTYFVFHKEH